MTISKSKDKTAQINASRWLQVLCRVSLFQYIVFPLYSWRREIFRTSSTSQEGLQKRPDREREWLENIVGLVCGIEEGQMSRCNLRSDFRNFSRSWQEKFCIPLIVKCLERSIQPAAWRDSETNRWYLPPTHGEFMSEEATDLFINSVPLFRGSGPQTTAFMRELIAFRDMNEVFLKPMIQVSFFSGPLVDTTFFCDLDDANILSSLLLRFSGRN